MYELDQYKQTHGDMDAFSGAPWKAIKSSQNASSFISSPMHKKQNIFEPTAVPN